MAYDIDGLVVLERVSNGLPVGDALIAGSLQEGHVLLTFDADFLGVVPSNQLAYTSRSDLEEWAPPESS